MTLPLHPIFHEASGDHMGAPAYPERGDALGLRVFLDAVLPVSFRDSDPSPDVRRLDLSTNSADGTEIGLRWYSRSDSQPGSAVVFIHGGGLIGGSVEAYDAFVGQHVAWTGVPMLSVEYRRAPDAKGDVPARDCFAALRWLIDHASDLQVDAHRIAIMGDSAGGGLAAATAILARDAGVPLARQVLIFPMLDDRTIDPDPHLADVVTWSHDDNRTGWQALLGDRIGGPEVSPYEAPARLTDFAGLAPAYVEVGTLDIFRDESIDYARRLLAAGVEAELHVHPGAPHGYDSLALGSLFAERWKADRIRVITGL